MNLTGDVLVSAGVMAYLGPFTATFRNGQLGDWVSLCKDKSIPCSASPTLSGEKLAIVGALVRGRRNRSLLVSSSSSRPSRLELRESESFYMSVTVMTPKVSSFACKQRRAS